MLPVRSGGLGGSRCEPNGGHRGLGAQAGSASIVLSRKQELFCSLSTGATKSGYRENINTLLISRGMWPIVEEVKMAPLRGLLSAGSEVGLPGFTSRLPHLSGSLRASLLPSVKWGCEDHLH